MRTDAPDTVPLTPGTPPGSHGFLGPDRWWHVGFGSLAAVTLIAFTLWSFGYVDGDVSPMLLILAILFGLFMSFNIGGNDVANSFGTSVGAGTLTMKQALMVAAVFEVSGAVMAGGAVTNTVRSGIVELSAISSNALDFAFIMMAALLGAAMWLLIATRRGWPVSTTHSIIGGIVGAAVTVGIVSGTGGFGMVQWGQIGQIAISWVLSPVLGALVSFLLFGAIKRRILVYNEKAEEALRELKRQEAETTERHRDAAVRLNDLQQTASTSAFEEDDLVLDVPVYTKRKAERKKLEQAYKEELEEIQSKANAIDPHRALQMWVPLLAAGGAAVIAAMLLFKGLDNLNLALTTTSTIMIICMVTLVVWMAISILAKTLQNQELSRSTFILFSWMQVFTASAFAFSHGANDIANAIGPFAAVLDVLATGEIGEEAVVPPAALLAFGIALIIGLWFVGRKVIATVGTNLTRIHPASGFAAELAAAGVVMAASVLGLPVSSTHILIGAVLGIGLVNRSANWNLMKPIALAWLITIPASAAIGSVAVLVLRTLF